MIHDVALFHLTLALLPLAWVVAIVRAWRRG